MFKLKKKYVGLYALAVIFFPKCIQALSHLGVYNSWDLFTQNIGGQKWVKKTCQTNKIFTSLHSHDIVTMTKVGSQFDQPIFSYTFKCFSLILRF